MAWLELIWHDIMNTPFLQRTAWAPWLVCGCSAPYTTKCDVLYIPKPFYQNQHFQQFKLEYLIYWIGPLRSAFAPYMHVCRQRSMHKRFRYFPIGCFSLQSNIVQLFFKENVNLLIPDIIQEGNSGWWVAQRHNYYNHLFLFLLPILTSSFSSHASFFLSSWRNVLV